jgi:hypothetical protein
LVPLKGSDQHRIWCALVALAMEITAWMSAICRPLAGSCAVTDRWPGAEQTSPSAS